MCWLVCASTLASGATLHTDDFQVNLAEWTSGGAAVSLETTGGPAGTNDGFMHLLPVFGNLATYNSSSSWIGNFTSIGAAKVTADLMAAVGSVPLSMRVVLFGPGTSPGTSPRWTSTVAAEVPADGVWRNYSFSLSESDLTQVLGADTYQNMMGNVLRVMLRHDSGPPDSGGEPVAGDLGIDNVSLSTDTLPGDFNNDGIIDGADFLIWQRGQSPRQLSAEDLMDWQANYGRPIGGDLFLPVPEPAVSPLLVLLVFLLRRAGQR